MKVKLVREKRKTIVLKVIDSENAILKVPQNLSEKKVAEFLEGKKKWLEGKSQKIKQNESFSKEFDLKNCFYLFGEKAGSFHDMIMGYDGLSEKDKSEAIKKTYLSHFSNLEDVAKKLSEQTGLVFDRVKPTSSSRIWGSYNSKKVMKLNWKLLILPMPLVNYVVCHELCHSRHMNHKPQFWQAVSRICPEYKTLKKRLNDFSFLLKNDF